MGSLKSISGTIDVGELRLVSEQESAEGQAVCLRWHGKASFRRPLADLQPVLQQVIDVANDEGCALKFQLEALEHFNSSTIVVLMKCIKRAESLGMPLSISFDPQKKWQKMTFEALRSFEQSGAGFSLVAL